MKTTKLQDAKKTYSVFYTSEEEKTEIAIFMSQVDAQNFADFNNQKLQAFTVEKNV